MAEEAMTVQAVAERLGLSKKTIYRQLWAGTFPCRAVKIGAHWRISRRDLDELLAEVDR